MTEQASSVEALAGRWEAEAERARWSRDGYFVNCPPWIEFNERMRRFEVKAKELREAIEQDKERANA